MSEPTDDQLADDPGLVVDADVAAVLADPSLWGEPPVDLADRVVRDISSESEIGPAGAARSSRSGARWAMLGAAAAVLAVLVTIVTISAFDGSGGRSVSAALLPTGRAGTEGGSLDLTESDTGVGIVIDVPALPPCEDGYYYEGWVATEDGLTMPAGTFHAGGAIELWAAAELDDVVGFTVTHQWYGSVEDVPVDAGDVVLKATVVAD